GFPPNGQGLLKIAKHHASDDPVDPERVRRTVTPEDEALIRASIAKHIAASTCLYTVTPDHDFLIDRLPGAPNILIASPCSGHGFKFAPVIGEILADLATDKKPAHDLSRFSIGRWS